MTHSFKPHHCTRKTIKAADDTLFHTSTVFRSVHTCLTVLLYIRWCQSLSRRTQSRQRAKMSYLTKQLILLTKAFQLFTPTFLYFIQCDTHKMANSELNFNQKLIFTNKNERSRALFCFVQRLFYKCPFVSLCLNNKMVNSVLLVAMFSL